MVGVSRIVVRLEVSTNENNRSPRAQAPFSLFRQKPAPGLYSQRPQFRGNFPEVVEETNSNRDFRLRQHGTERERERG